MRPCLLFPTLLLLLAPTAHAQSITDADIDNAISKLQAYFWHIQDADTGAWPQQQFDSGLQRGGESALVVTALIASGINAQHPRLVRAIDYLKGVDMVGTYAVAQRAHVWSHLSRDFATQLQNDSQWLVRAATPEGRYGYSSNAAGGTNLSTTHYGILGLWEASKSGLLQPRPFWLTAEQSIIGIQNRDGGWGYTPMGVSSGSMTAAGLTILLISQQLAHREDMRPDENLETAINRGVDWLDKRFINHENINGTYTFYYLYALERVALACGVKQFNGRDWFQIGARFIIDEQADNGEVGGNMINSAFALLFLSRGHIPVWIRKLTLPEGHWNHRPNDINFLSSHLSNFREGEINWQTLGIDEPIEAWTDSPATYLATDRDIPLTAQRQETLRQYLDLGGTLIVNPDQGSAAPGRAIRRFAAKHYPQWPMRELAVDDPIYNVLQQMDGMQGQRVFALSNGVRNLILLSERDWGFIWQAKDDLDRQPAGMVAANIWAILTDRGLLRTRLHPRFEPRDKRDEVGEITIARARYEGNWLPEPQAWPVFATAFFNQTGHNLNIVDIDLDAIGETDAPLVHLAGVDEIELTEAQLNAIGRYTNRKGTLLVETAGGMRDFSRAIERQIMTRFHTPAVPLYRDQPIISGVGLGSGYNCAQVQYRRFAAFTMQLGFVPRVAAMMLDSEPSVVYFSEDLSQGMLRVNHWGVAGYDSPSAERLMTNLTLWAASRQLKEATQ